jgi:hypothetical protein
LEEQTLNLNSGKFTPTHSRLLSAYKSLKNNLPYLFTYKKFRKLDFPNTTNALDRGVFTYMKKLMKLHQIILYLFGVLIIEVPVSYTLFTFGR